MSGRFNKGTRCGRLISNVEERRVGKKIDGLAITGPIIMPWVSACVPCKDGLIRPDKGHNGGPIVLMKANVR